MLLGPVLHWDLQDAHDKTLCLLPLKQRFSFGFCDFNLLTKEGFSGFQAWFVAEEQRCTRRAELGAGSPCRARGAPAVCAGFDVLPRGGQGFGRSLPFGSCVLLEVTQAGSLNRIVEPAEGCPRARWAAAERSPRIQGSPPKAVTPRAGQARTLGVASGRGGQEKSLEASPQHRGLAGWAGAQPCSRKLPPSLGPALRSLPRFSLQTHGILPTPAQSTSSVLLLNQMLSLPPCHCNHRATV